MSKLPELRGLVLSGGKSSRMGQDKGALIYPRPPGDPGSGLDARARGLKLLEPFCVASYISCREAQLGLLRPEMPRLVDAPLEKGGGPGVGILTAARAFPGCAWLVLACDFPYVDRETIERLASRRDPGRAATAYEQEHGVLEPLLAIWEPEALARLAERFARGRFSPREALEGLLCVRVPAPAGTAMVNANTPTDQISVPVSVSVSVPSQF